MKLIKKFRSFYKMKEWRSKYDRITESEIIKYIADRNTTYYVVAGMLCTVEEKSIYWEIVENDDLYLSLVQYLQKEKVNVFNTIKELKESLKIEDR